MRAKLCVALVAFLDFDASDSVTLPLVEQSVEMAIATIAVAQRSRGPGSDRLRSAAQDGAIAYGGQS